MVEMEKHFISDYNYSNYYAKGNEIIFETTGIPKVRIDLCYEDTFRVWVDQTGKLNKERSFAVENEVFKAIDYKIIEEENRIIICNKEVSIYVNKRPFRISFHKLDSTLITSELNSGWLENGSVFLYNNMEDEEHFYGLGEDNEAYLGNLDRRKTLRNMITGQTITKGCVTSEIPVTFFMSTGNKGEGYGMFVDNTYPMEFNMGRESEDYYFWKAEGGELIYYFIYGPSFIKILDKYTSLTGRPSMPPLWSLGFLQSKCSYKNWDEMDDVISTLREKKIPMDLMVFDFDWAEQMMNFKWNSSFKGQILAKLDQHKKNGVKFMVSNSGPMIKKNSSNYSSGLESGIFATDGKGNTVTCGHYGGDLIDFTAPNIKEWIAPQLKPIFQDGIEAWWLDLTEPEGEPVQTVYKHGPRAKIHNVYSLLNTKAYYEMHKEFDENSRPFILTRTGTAGIQKYGVAIWTGDVYSDYETLAAHCPEALNTTMSGISAWTSDTSGFISSTYDVNSETYIHLYKNDITAQGLLYERWLQFSCFTPITRAHHVGPSAPYEFGNIIEEGCRHYLNLRYKLLPYIYSYVFETYKTGSPIMRALIYEYQKDPKVVNLKDEYLFGRELLIAPVLTENTTARKVYFPEGKWIDYDYGYEYEGNKTYTVYAPQNRIPVFVKAGAIIPMAPIMQYADEKPWSPITLDIYPYETSSFKLYSDDGRTMEFETKGKFTVTEIKCVEVKASSIIIDIDQSNKLYTPSKYEFVVHLLSNPVIAYANENLLMNYNTLSKYNSSQEGLYWDKVNYRLYVKFDTDESVVYRLLIELDGKILSRVKAPKVELVASESIGNEKEKAEVQIPYFLPPATLPCRIQIENFDRGGEGVAYHVKTQGNLGGKYRKENINIELTTDVGGGYHVFDLVASEWLKYTVNVTEAARYDISFRVASEMEISCIHVELNNKDVTGPTYINSTSGNQNFTTVTVKNLKLNKGEQVMKVSIDKGKVTLNYIDIEEGDYKNDN